MAQFFGLMPICGVLAKDVSKLSYRLRTVRQAYSFLVFGLVCFYAYLTIRWSVEESIEFVRLGKQRNYNLLIQRLVIDVFSL